VADLKVDYEALVAAERGLERIIRRLGAAETYRDDLEHAWGCRRIADAMAGFVDNWDRHRKGLEADITTVGTMCGEARATFLRIEQALRAAAGTAAEAIPPRSSTSTSGPGS
jgi:hypothetical protein